MKVHGGATVLNGAYTTKDAKVSEREGLYVEEKRSIAKLAAALIGQEDFVYIDAGTSTASLAEAISEREAVYVTNGKTTFKHLPSGLLLTGMHRILKSTALTATEIIVQKIAAG